jgi:hypothetical protein
MLTDALGRGISFLPNLVAALIILAVGLFISKALSKLTERALRSLGLERRESARKLLGERASLERVPRGAGRVVYWALGLVTIGVAVDALHLAWLSAGVGRVLAYLPNVIAAGAIVLCGYLAGTFVYRQIGRREAGSALMPRLARGAIYALAAFMALQELGIATAIVTVAFTAAISAMAIAAALAFGLGNRELAGQVTRDWYARRSIAQRPFEELNGKSQRSTLSELHEVGPSADRSPDQPPQHH